MKKIILLAALVALALVPKVNAGAQSQTDTNLLAVLSTNTFSLFGDVTGSFTNGETASGNSLITCLTADDVYIAYGGFYTNTGSGASNVFYRVAQTVDNANWTNSAAVLTLVVPALSTNWAVGHTVIQNAFPAYGLRAVENTNASGVTARAGTIYLKAYTKSGI